MTLPRRPDQVRDQRIEQIVPLLTPAEILGELPLAAEQAEVVLRGRSEIGSILDHAGRPAARSRGPLQRARPGRGPRVRRSPSRGRRRAARRPLHRHARVLREAAHDDGLEGHDQRPPPRRVGRREQRSAHGARPAPRGPRPRSAGGLRVPRPDHPAVHLRRGGLGRDRRAHHREPDAPPARLRSLDAGGLQEPHRRQRAGRRRRGARRRGAPRVHGRRRERAAGDPLHHRQPRLPRDPARWARRAQLPGRAPWRTPSCSCARRGCRSGS